MENNRNFEEISAELDELAAVPTDVLAAWVTDQGKCLWESTFGDPPSWTGADGQDRELATQMCAGCPVRAECLELELRVGGEDSVGVWGALNEQDRRDLHAIWSRRRRVDLEAMSDEGGQ